MESDFIRSFSPAHRPGAPSALAPSPNRLLQGAWAASPGAFLPFILRLSHQRMDPVLQTTSMGPRQGLPGLCAVLIRQARATPHWLQPRLGSPRQKREGQLLRLWGCSSPQTHFRGAAGGSGVALEHESSILGIRLAGVAEMMGQG